MKSSQYSNPTYNKALTLREGSKITPGPWRIEQGGYNLRGPNGEYIAVVNTAPTKRAAANALAIATLPELVESFKELIALLDAGFGDEWNRGYGRMAEAKERALAALAKAEGRGE
jgi:hypothetical protein